MSTEPTYCKTLRKTITEEDPCRRPPPSTSSPCPAWFFRLHSPFFRGSEAPIQEGFAPIQLLALIQLAEKRAPDLQPDLLLLPVSQAPPAGRRMRKFFRQILPASPAAQNPQNAFQYFAVIRTRASAARALRLLREQGPDLFPLRLGQRPTVSRHRPSPWRFCPCSCTESGELTTSKSCSTQFCNWF